MQGESGTRPNGVFLPRPRDGVERRCHRLAAKCAGGERRAARASPSPSRALTRLCAKNAQMGDPAVGKSALTQMFHSNGQRFPKAYQMTCGVDFCAKAVRVPETEDAVELHIFDTAGQARRPRATAPPLSRLPLRLSGQGRARAQDVFAEMMPDFWQDAKGVVLVYDVTRIHTLEACAI